MKKTFLGFFALVTLAISCKKSDTTPDATPAQPYMSLTVGSIWDYQITNILTAAVVINKVTSLTADSTVNGKKYHVFTNSNGTGNSYYNITGNEYWTFASLGAAANGIETIYLQTGKNTGFSWATPVSLPINGGATLPVTLTNTITEKGISKTVNGIIYTDVIKVITTIAASALPPNSLTTDIQSYYAPKVGLIESKYKIDLPLATFKVDQNTILKTSAIK